ARLYAYLQDDLTRTWPSVDLILDVLSPPDTNRLLHLRYLVQESPLWRHHLLEYVPMPGVAHPALLGQSIRPDEGIVVWLLLGHYQPPVRLAALVAYTPSPGEDGAVLSEESRQAVRAAAAGDALVVLHGIDTAGQAMAARL